ncbi:hypothetical protein C922_05643, partial [Plasmodium inui San Antonio 1]
TKKEDGLRAMELHEELLKQEEESCSESMTSGEIGVRLSSSCESGNSVECTVFSEIFQGWDEDEGDAKGKAGDEDEGNSKRKDGDEDEGDVGMKVKAMLNV